MARLLCLVTFYSSVIVLDSVDVDRVGTMNELLSNPGWPELNTYTEPLKIIERWMETEQHCDIRLLLELGANGQIVTDDNVDCKIRHAHLFLSCKYADDLKKYCEFERGIVHQCSRVEDPTESLECFETFVKDLNENNDRLISRMRGALLCFYELSPNTVHNKDVFQILEEFRNYYKTNQYEATTSETGSVIKAKISAIEKHVFTTIELLSAFFNSYCWPISYEEEHYGVSSTREYVEAITNTDTPGYASYCMRGDVEKKIDKYIRAHYELLGFEYNSGLSTTRIDYDPERITRVNQMNALVLFPGWSRMDTDEIIENMENRRMGTRVWDVLKKSQDETIVNKKNVSEKIRQVHQTLSCEYIIVMKTFHDHWLGIANECSKIDTADCWRHFWIIVKEIDPMVLYMQGALSYFYRLSSQTEYEKGVYEILGELKNYYDSVDLSDSWLTKTRTLIEMKLWKTKSLTEKINPLFGFFRRNCWTNPPLFSRPIPEDTGLSIELREVDIKKIINKFIETTYGSLGFTYDLESNTTKLMKIDDE